MALFARMFVLVVFSFFCWNGSVCGDDFYAKIQVEAIQKGKSKYAHWGSEPDKYISWSSHSNRLIPIYTWGTQGAGEGIDLTSYTGENSVYRSTDAIEKLYGHVPQNTLNPTAEYCDQTNIYDIQKQALISGKKKYIFLVVFDGMDWHATRAAAIRKTGELYNEGRGHGLFIQDYIPQTGTQFGFMVTSPYADNVRFNVDTQSVGMLEKEGGYDPQIGGPFPWSPTTDPGYIIGKGQDVKHAYTDSATSAASMSAGIKSFNGSITVDWDGAQAKTIAHEAQEKGFAVGVVTSVPISHATPGAMYAHNVTRNDYQDISRDLLGLPSVSHPVTPLPGMDVVIGTGYGVSRDADAKQGANYQPGNKYLADKDLHKADVKNGGKYVVGIRTAGKSGAEVIKEAANQAIQSNNRLLGYFGTRYDHLPYATANGDYMPVPGLENKSEGYTSQDVHENPTLVDLTKAGIDVLSKRSDKGFWMLMEPGEVDWSMHQNNLDDMVGAIYSGDTAVRVIADWVEANSNWEESLLIVTADHGHYLVLDDPAAIASGQ